jgi:hypothetical protein
MSPTRGVGSVRRANDPTVCKVVVLFDRVDVGLDRRSEVRHISTIAVGLVGNKKDLVFTQSRLVHLGHGRHELWGRDVL